MAPYPLNHKHAGTHTHTRSLLLSLHKRYLTSAPTPLPSTHTHRHHSSKEGARLHIRGWETTGTHQPLICPKACTQAVQGCRISNHNTGAPLVNAQRGTETQGKEGEMMMSKRRKVGESGEDARGVEGGKMEGKGRKDGGER